MDPKLVKELIKDCDREIQQATALFNNRAFRGESVEWVRAIIKKAEAQRALLVEHLEG